MAAVRKEISKDDYKFFIGRVEKIGNGQVEFITDTQKKAVELLGEKIPQNVIDAEDNYKAFNIWLGSEINPIIVGEGGYKEEIHVIGDGYDFFEVKAETGNTEFKYYLKALRPLFGAVPSGYIQAEKFENAVRIPRQGYVFGTVIYNKPLTDEQVRIYDLKPDKNNPQPEDNTAAAVSNAEITACLDDYAVDADVATDVEIENAAAEVEAEKNPLKEKIQAAELAAENSNAKRHAFLKNFYLKMCGEYYPAEGYVDYVTDYAKIIYRKVGENYVEDAMAFAELKEIECNLKAQYCGVAKLKNIASKADILKAKIAEQKSRSHKSIIDWSGTFEDMKISEILSLQKEFKKFLKLGQIDLAENVFSMLKTLCKNYREQFAA